MRHIILLFTFFTLSIPVFAQTGKISGKVADAKTGNRISAVTIQVVEIKKEIAADLEGNFSLTVEANKKYSLKITGCHCKRIQ